MFEPKSFSELCRAMQAGAIVVVGKHCGQINSISREDGSGRCFNIVMDCVNDPCENGVKVFWREAK